MPAVRQCGLSRRRCCARWSSGPPAVGLLAQFQVHEGLRTCHARNGPHAADDLQELVVVLADDLDEEIERPRCDDHIVDFIHAREEVGHRLDVADAPDADHQRVSHRDARHPSGVDQPLHPLAHRGLGQPDRLADRRVGAPAVLLKLLDDLLRDVIEHDARNVTGGPVAAQPTARGGRRARRVCHASASFASQSCHDRDICQLIPQNRVLSTTDSLVSGGLSCQDRTQLAAPGEPGKPRAGAETPPVLPGRPSLTPSAPAPARLQELRNFVNGAFTGTQEGAVSDIVHPSTGEAYAQAPVSGGADVDAAVRAAATAFGTWRDTTPAERSLALLRMAGAIEARGGQITAAECRNTGKPAAMTLAEEIPPLVDELRFFAGAARVLEGKAAGEYLRGCPSMIRREPVGVCAQVTPWNYPMMMAVWKFAPALAAGNTVVLKPSDTTPVTSLLLAEIAAEFL